MTESKPDPEVARTPRAAATSSRVVVLVGIMAVAFGVYYVACSPPKGLAKKAFATEFSCPDERVEIRQRDDVHGSQFHDRRPPPEVSADPARYAVWKKDDDAQRANEDMQGNYGQYYYEVRGCDHQGLYRCSRKPSCSKVEYPAGVAKW